MTTTTETRGTGWLPDFCPGWCTVDHAKVYDECGDLEAAREHYLGGAEENLLALHGRGARAQIGPRTTPGLFAAVRARLTCRMSMCRWTASGCGRAFRPGRPVAPASRAALEPWAAPSKGAWR